MKLTVAFQNSDVVLAVEVSEGMNVEDFMAYALNEAGFPMTSSTVVQWQGKLLERQQTLGDSGLSDEDMVVVANGVAQSDQSAYSKPSQGNGQQRFAGSQSSGRISAAQVEQLRQEILYNPDQFKAFSEKLPELAATVHDAQEFAQAFAERELMHQQMWSNPDSHESQTRIAELLSQQQLDDNLRAAMEEMPESFAPVTMLYIDVEINGVPVKAFVDSGAQSTILSPECAEKCQIGHLIDKRYKGTAYGVGTSEILGRIHMAPMKIGSGYYPCGFTVLGGTKIDLLFGLDMLRHHQASIDLKRNALVLGSESVPFLGEGEIPKSFHEIAEAHQASANAAKAAQSRASQNAAPAPMPTQTPREPPRPDLKLPARPEPPAQTQQFQQPATQAFQPPAGPPGNEQVVQNLMSLGFSRDRVNNALRRADNDPEIAANILFEES